MMGAALVDIENRPKVRNMRRRTFIQSTALAVAGTNLSASAFAEGSKYKNKVGLQLYSLRDVIFKDPKGVLRSVADFGYRELETFGYVEGKLFGLPVREYGDYVEDFATENHQWSL